MRAGRPAEAAGSRIEAAGAASAGEAAELTMEAVAAVDLTMRQRKDVEDLADGAARVVGDAIALAFGRKTRRLLWTKADFAHIHAVSGAGFLGLGFAWLVASFASEVAAPDAYASAVDFSGAFLMFVLLSGVVNTLSAIPMARFSSDRLLDLSDLKANGFTLGGTGLTLMCLWASWWFSGAYPSELEPLGPAFFALWTFICVATTWNWETMLQQAEHFEEDAPVPAGGLPKDRKARKLARPDGSQGGLGAEKTLLYRLASWPNLTQLAFLWSPCIGGRAWLDRVEVLWPGQHVPLYHYCLASALGYSLSMFSETLRDRKLISLRTDLLILVIGVFLPMVAVVADRAVLGGGLVTVNPLDYWYF